MDYSVEYLDAGDLAISEEIFVGKSSLVAALHQIIRSIDNDDQLKVFATGLNIRVIRAFD